MTQEPDPYAPPPRYKMRSGGIMRFVILAALLGAAAWAYVSFSNQPQTASLVPPAQDEQMADAGYQALPTPEASAPGHATTPAPTRTTPPAQRASSPAPNENGPAPSTSTNTPPAG